ncbi:MAG: hypothetical protein ACRBBS_02975 [Thalassovita sp.]
MWFLSLTLISFCWFHDLSRNDKVIRFALLALAGLMATYSGGRMILLLWLLSGAALGVYLLLTRPKQTSTPPRHGPDLALLMLELRCSLGCCFKAQGWRYSPVRPCLPSLVWPAFRVSTG